MESGSLLQEALDRQAELHSHTTQDDPALWLDLYLLYDGNDNRIQHLLALTKLAHDVNTFFQKYSSKYQWHVGGDGPVFGIHTSGDEGGIPHLRAICRYGDHVADEWAAVALMMKCLKEQQQQSAVCECWDVQDGQLLLIESANVLPNWVDDMGPEACRHRCWICHGGNIELLAPKEAKSNITLQSTADHSLTIREALKVLKQGNSSTTTIETPHRVQQAIQECIDRLVPSTLLKTKSHKSQNFTNEHKAAIALPREVAFLIQDRPDLVNAAVMAFAHQVLYPASIKNKSSNPSTKQSRNSNAKASTAIVCEDWVFTTHSFSRTNFAMLRTMVSPMWKTESFVPKQYQSVELRRIQRQCAMEATPHLRHSVQVGIRLVAGFQALLDMPKRNNNSSAASMSLQERRVLHYWPRFLQNHLGMSSDWLMQAWQAGPNHSSHRLDDLLKCPVVQDEFGPHNLTAWSHPETSVADQIRQALRQSRNQESDAEFLLPRQDQVDLDEKWMELSFEAAEQEMSSMKGQPVKAHTNINIAESQQKEAANQLDTMLDSFQSFMADKSSFEGVTHNDGSNAERPEAPGGEKQLQPINSINPRAFLNLLKSTLDPSTTPDDLATRLQFNESARDTDYFSKEDYDAMLPENDDDNDDEEIDEGTLPIDKNVLDLMDAMDEELKGTLAAETGNGLHEIGLPTSNSSTEDEARILTNLLQSLDSGSGGPGPVQSIMTAMGNEAPLVSPEGVEIDGVEDHNN